MNFSIPWNKYYFLFFFIFLFRSKARIITKLFGLPPEPQALITPHPAARLVTAKGVAKQLTAEEVLGTKSGKPVIGLKGDDRVVAAFRAPAGILIKDAEARAVGNKRKTLKAVDL